MLFFMLPKSPLLRKKGEEKKEGTIEKIQRQLDSQTEVWTIFNKPINNPRVFKDGLIDGNEKESLKILNKKNGKHFRQTLHGASNSQRPNGFLWSFIGVAARE
ncbi:hypothetical protein VN0031_07140 [Helicobacter pylori]